MDAESGSVTVIILIIITTTTTADVTNTILQWKCGQQLQFGQHRVRMGEGMQEADSIPAQLMCFISYSQQSVADDSLHDNARGSGTNTLTSHFRSA